MPNSGNFEDEQAALIGQDPEQGGFTNPNIPQNEIDAAMRQDDDNASMISGGDAVGVAEVMEKGAEGQAQSLSETVKAATTVPQVFEKKPEEKKTEESGMSSSEMMTAGITVLAFIAFDCGKVLFEGFSATGHSSFNMAAFLAFVSFLNIFLSLGMTVVNDGMDGLRTAFGPSIFNFIFPSLFFAGSQLLNILQNAEIAPDLRKVLQQLRIPITAIFSKFVMGHGYTSMQWYLICMVVLSVVSFNIAVSGSGLLIDPSGSNNIGPGFLLAVLSNVAACLGSLTAEKYCKESAKTPFYIQKFQIEVWTFLSSLLNIALLQPAIGALADLIFEGSLGKRSASANPTMSKTMQFTHSPFASTQPWSTAVQGKKVDFPNKFDTLSWETKLDETLTTYVAEMKDFVPVQVPAEYQASFDQAEYQTLVKMIADIAATQKARKEGRLSGDASEYASRSGSKEFQTLISGSKAIWKTLAAEGKFVVGHGFAANKVAQPASGIVKSFGFTWGHVQDQAFVSQGPAQRPSPRLTSWWLTQSPADEKKYLSPATPSFTHSERIAVDDIKAELQRAKEAYQKAEGEAFVQGDKAPLVAVNGEAQQTGIQTTTFTKQAYHDAAEGTLSITFAKKVERKFATTTTALTCVTEHARLVLPLQCDTTTPLHYTAEEDLVMRAPRDCKLSPSYWVKGSEEVCTIAHTAAPWKDSAAAKDWAKTKKDAEKAKERAEKDKSEAEKKQEKRGKDEKALTKATPPKAGSAVSGWEGDFAKYLFVDLPKAGMYQVYSYPGKVGAGAPLGKGFVCDKQMCELSEEEWQTNYGYMRNHWKNRPMNPVGDAALNPFAWGEMHPYTWWWLPGPVWTSYAILALIANIGQSWLSGLIAKVLSSLAKNLCQAVALALVVIIQKMCAEVTTVPQSIGLVGGPKWLESMIGMSGVLLIVWTFSQAPKAPKPSKH